MTKEELALLGVTEEEYSNIKPAEVSNGFLWEPGSYVVQIAEAFVRKTDNNAKMLELKFVDKDGIELKHSANTMYTDKKTGEATINKSGIIIIKQLEEAAKVESAGFKAAQVEFGQENKTIDVLAALNLTGKKVTICVTQREDDYNENYPVKNDVYMVLDESGNNSAGENQLEAFTEKIEKTPLIPLSKKKKAAQTAKTDAQANAGNAAAGSGWS